MLIAFANSLVADQARQFRRTCPTKLLDLICIQTSGHCDDIPEIRFER